MEERSNWSLIRIPHSQKDEINLYLRQEGELIEMYITDEKNGRVLTHDRLIGSLNEITLDQFNTEVKWTVVEKSFKNCSVEFDMAEVRKKNGYHDKLDYMKYHIGNAINSSFSNKGFSQFLKKNILGTWTSENFELKFTEDGHLVTTGEVPQRIILLTIPKFGIWSISRNMLYVMHEGSGMKTQIVDLIEDKLLFPGGNGELFYIMTRK